MESAKNFGIKELGGERLQQFSHLLTAARRVQSFAQTMQARGCPIDVAKEVRLVAEAMGFTPRAGAAPSEQQLLAVASGDTSALMDILNPIVFSATGTPDEVAMGQLVTSLCMSVMASTDRSEPRLQRVDSSPANS